MWVRDSLHDYGPLRGICITNNSVWPGRACPVATSLKLLKGLVEFQEPGESSADNSTDLRVSRRTIFLNIFSVLWKFHTFKQCTPIIPFHNHCLPIIFNFKFNFKVLLFLKTLGTFIVRGWWVYDVGFKRSRKFIRRVLSIMHRQAVWWSLWKELRPIKSGASCWQQHHLGRRSWTGWEKRKLAEY